MNRLQKQLFTAFICHKTGFLPRNRFQKQVVKTMELFRKTEECPSCRNKEEKKLYKSAFDKGMGYK